MYGEQEDGGHQAGCYKLLSTRIRDTRGKRATLQRLDFSYIGERSRHGVGFSMNCDLFCLTNMFRMGRSMKKVTIGNLDRASSSYSAISSGACFKALTFRIEKPRTLPDSSTFSMT